MNPLLKPPRGWFDHLFMGLLFYYLTGAVGVAGVAFGHSYLEPSPEGTSKRADVFNAFASWDGQWYLRITQQGYEYDPERYSTVAFFPAFPLIGRFVLELTGLRPELALLLVSHVCLVGAFIVLAAYVRARFPGQPAIASYTLLAFGLVPTTFFFRMAYSESLFLLVCIMATYGMARRWPLVVIATLIGLATAARPVGVALLAPFVLHLWDPSPPPLSPKGRGEKNWPVYPAGRGEKAWRGFVLRSLVYLPLACWGLVGYMLYQYLAFDEPVAFAKTQVHWRVRAAVVSAEHLWALVRFEPIWSVFDPESPCYWGKHDRNVSPLFSLHLANPSYFVLAIVLLLVGVWKRSPSPPPLSPEAVAGGQSRPSKAGEPKRWLNRYEIALCIGLLFIPYVTRSHEMCMGSMGRFAAAAFPLYLVLGRLLAKLPAPLAAALVGVSGLLLGTYAALFAAWYRIF